MTEGKKMEIYSHAGPHAVGEGSWKQFVGQPCHLFFIRIPNSKEVNTVNINDKNNQEKNACLLIQGRGKGC